MRKKVTSKKTTTSQGIGRIEDAPSLIDLVKELGKIISDGFVQSSDRTPQINYIKRQIDQLVGRSRSNFTKTDVYQALFLMVLGSYQENQGEIPFTKVNTIVAKLSTEGQYGNTGVVRRQTTIEKFSELFNRILSWGTRDEGRIRTFANTLYSTSLTSTRKDALWSIVGPTSVGARGRTGTRTERVSNRTRRDTTGRSQARRITTPAITTPTQQARQTSTPTTPVTVSPSTRLSSSATMSLIDSRIKFVMDRININGSDWSNPELFRALMYCYRLELLFDIEKVKNMEGVGAEVITNAQKNAYGQLKSRIERISASETYVKRRSKLLILAIPYTLCKFKVNDAKKVFSPYLIGTTKQKFVTSTLDALGFDTRTNIGIKTNFARLMGGAYTITRPAVDDLFYSYRGTLSNRSGNITITIDKYEKVFNLRALINASLDVQYVSNLVRMSVAPETPSSSSVPTRSSTSTSSPQVTDNNPRSTTPPEASQTSTLIREIPFTDTVGVEIEYYGVPPRVIEKAFKKYNLDARDNRYTHQVTVYWKIVPDVSVSGPNAGELVSPILKGKRGLVDLVKGCRACADAGLLMDESGGLHVHFGASGWSLQTIKNLIYNYHGFQDIIRKMLPDWRRERSKKGETTKGYKWGKFYTRSEVDRIQDANDMQDIFRILTVSSDRRGSGPRGEFIIDDNRESGRYRSINVFCYLKYGTFEFRQYAGNIEADTVLNWVYFLHFLIEASKKKRLTQFNWKNVENILPKKVATFWANRIYELSDGTDQVVSDLSSRREL
jgi:hypothetical protein